MLGRVLIKRANRVNDLDIYIAVQAEKNEEKLKNDL